ncbi:Tn3 family transposase (plasmid) [Streptomyces sp. NBC_00841]|uniref:Tn3 family transposase n=1 Tax=Streptomyces sp. NBC_00841 TaxID=2975847 RepID=UPI002DDC0C05|nr:Tn3 family transposase [Streptomyces sp. NBC_00841]WSA05607.1 Tn3 family transposase [Streptomyces sp. NBC_00841]
MLPRVDFPELLLEVAELTSMADAFTHISGADSGMEGFTTSLCAVLLSEACDVGLTSVIKPDVPALTRGRLVQVDHINFLGRYAFTRPPAPGLRQLRAPHIDDETDDGED